MQVNISFDPITELDEARELLEAWRKASPAVVEASKDFDQVTNPLVGRAKLEDGTIREIYKNGETVDLPPATEEIDFSNEAMTAPDSAPDREPIEQPTARPTHDDKGVAFNEDYCAKAKEPFYTSGPKTGQWKKRQKVEQAAYDAWYAEQLNDGEPVETSAAVAFAPPPPSGPVTLDVPDTFAKLIVHLQKNPVPKEKVDEALMQKNYTGLVQLKDAPTEDIIYIYNRLMSV